MSRLLFEKTGRAVWISHLDLMRLFQRAFKRADLPLTHTQGFNPRPSVSIALPLSVGVESVCELLDFTLDADGISNEEICQRLNKALVEGITVHAVYDTGRKLRELVYLSSEVDLTYDGAVPQDAAGLIRALFDRESIIVPKKTKSGMQDQDIKTMICSLTVTQPDSHTVRLSCVGFCQNPTLNPAQLSAAIALYLPAYKASFACCRRLELYDKDMNIFR